MAILCKNGIPHTHQTVEESRKCWARVLDVDASADAGVTESPPAPPAPVPYAMQPRTSVPLAMLTETPDGYYAVRLDDTDSFQFLRISRKFSKRSNKVGCIQVQRQASETLYEILLYRPLGSPNEGDKEWLRTSRPQYDKYVILVMVDPIASGLAYAKELEHCCKCGKALTDARSIHYGIGPECEKRWPEVIAYVDGQEGGNK